MKIIVTEIDKRGNEISDTLNTETARTLVKDSTLEFDCDIPPRMRSLKINGQELEGAFEFDFHAGVNDVPILTIKKHPALVRENWQSR